MQATGHRCPECARPLYVCSDMWGPYYLCDVCGWTAEDDDELRGKTSSSPLLDSLSAMTEAERPQPGAEAA